MIIDTILRTIYFVFLIIMFIVPFLSAFLVSRLGKVGLRSYIVGIGTYVSSYILYDIVGTVLSFASISAFAYSVATTLIYALLQVLALRYFMHVYLKRHTYAVFYGAGVGFATGSLVVNGIVTTLSKIGVIDLINGGTTLEELGKENEALKELGDIVLSETVLDAISASYLFIMFFVLQVTLAVTIGHAVRNEPKYLYGSIAVWLPLNVLFLTDKTMPSWLQIAASTLLIAMGVYLMLWSVKKYGLDKYKKEENDFHDKLARRDEAKKKKK